MTGGQFRNNVVSKRQEASSGILPLVHDRRTVQEYCSLYMTGGHEESSAIVRKCQEESSSNSLKGKMRVATIEISRTCRMIVSFLEIAALLREPEPHLDSAPALLCGSDSATILAKYRIFKELSAADLRIDRGRILIIVK
jgi:hypothetical protein